MLSNNCSSYLPHDFAHKGLQNFYLKGNAAGIQPIHKKRIGFILVRLESIKWPEDMDLPGFDFHKRTGKLRDYYSVSVNKNWRIIFKYDGIDAYDIDYIDYH